MKYIIDKTNKAPAYMQLYEQIKTDIIQNNLKKGEKLPSKRLLSFELCVSVITVEHAYSLLADEGLVESHERSGYFVSSGATEGYAPQQKRKAITHSPDENDYPFSAFSKNIRRVLSEYGSAILSKAPGSGMFEFKEAIANYLLRSRGMKVNPNQIIIGSGAQYLYSLVVQLLGRETVFALEDPSYSNIKNVYEINGANCVYLKLGADGILTSELNNCFAGALHVTPYNSYPSGITAGHNKRSEYVSWARMRGAYIIEDDYDSEFSSALKTVSTIYSLARERVIYINTFSCTISPGVRTGYMVLPEALLNIYEQKLGFYTCTVPVFEQLVLTEFINSGEFERHINRRRRKLRQ